MDALAIILIAVAAVVLALLVGGFAATRRRSEAEGADYARHVAEADHALEQARAADRGWDRDVLDEAARAALESARPGLSYERLHLVLVDDRPGIEEDRAQYVAVGGDGETRVVLVRGADGWSAESIE